MRLKSLALSLTLASACGGGGSHKPSQQEKFPEEPIPEPQIPEKIPEEPKKTFSFDTKTVEPLKLSPFDIFRVELKKPAEDLIEYFKGAVKNWGVSRDTGHIPEEYLKEWSGRPTYDIPEDPDHPIPEDHKKRLDGYFDRMIKRCPVLAKPEYNSPVHIQWYYNLATTGISGKYTGNQIHLISGENGKTIYAPTMFSFLKNSITLHPEVSHREKTYVHEWGHHLAASIDFNMGRVSYATHEFNESWAEIIRYLCYGSFYHKEDDYAFFYGNWFDNFQGSKEYLSRDRSVASSGEQYSIKSLEACFLYEKKRGFYNHRFLLNAVIEAYKRIEGRKRDNFPYPTMWQVKKEGGGNWITGSWMTGLFEDGGELAKPKYQPLIVTKAEFLERFKEVYECGDEPEELIDAEIEGLKKFEW